MDKINTLITCAGAPGIKGVIYSLKNNYDKRKIRTIGADIKEEVVGKYLCDGFYKIPKPSESSFIYVLKDICEKEEIDVILSLIEDELIVLALHRSKFEKMGVKIPVSSYQTIRDSGNKFNLLRISKSLKLPTTEYHLVDNFSDLERSLTKLGYPDKPVVIKPPISHGMRGLRIITESVNRQELFYTEKPSQVHITIEELKNTLNDTFPELLMMEYLPGVEYTVDAFSFGDHSIIIPRTRDLIRTGITFNGTVTKNKDIIDATRKLSEQLELEYAYGFQFKMDENNVPKLIECNPRIQGTMVLATLAGANLIYSSVKAALSEEIPSFNVKWGTKLFRYWGGVYVGENTGEMI